MKTKKSNMKRCSKRNSKFCPLGDGCRHSKLHKCNSIAWENKCYFGPTATKYIRVECV